MMTNDEVAAEFMRVFSVHGMVDVSHSDPLNAIHLEIQHELGDILIWGRTVERGLQLQLSQGGENMVQFDRIDSVQETKDLERLKVELFLILGLLRSLVKCREDRRAHA